MFCCLCSYNAEQTQWPPRLGMNKYVFCREIIRYKLINKKPYEAVLHGKRVSLKTAWILCSYKIVATAMIKYTNVQEIFTFIIIQCQLQCQCEFYILYVAPLITTRVDQWAA